MRIFGVAVTKFFGTHSAKVRLPPDCSFSCARVAFRKLFSSRWAILYREQFSCTRVCSSAVQGSFRWSEADSVGRLWARHKAVIFLCNLGVSCSASYHIVPLLFIIILSLAFVNSSPDDLSPTRSSNQLHRAVVRMLETFHLGICEIFAPVAPCYVQPRCASHLCRRICRSQRPWTHADQQVSPVEKA